MAGNEEGGPTVSYTNTTAGPLNCVGFTMPYSTVDQAGIDPSGLDLGNLAESVAVVTAIETAGGVSLLRGDDGQPVAVDSDFNPAGVLTGVFGMVFSLGLNPDSVAVSVPAGGTVSWDATAPTTPAAAVTLCLEPGQTLLTDIQLDFGVDPQVVADQTNGRIPGGSLDLVTPGMISGGSVAAGAGALGSLAGGDGDEDEAAGGSAAGSSGGSGNDDDGEIPVETVE